MKTKIATTFGLALMLGLGLFATMLALGTFNSVSKVHAAVSDADVTVSPLKARETAQVTIVVSATQAVAVGQRIIVKFNTSTGVPSSIATTNVKLKATVMSGSSDGTTVATQQVDSAAITVSGKEVAITVGDMNTGTAAPNIGDQGIANNSKITITFLQAAGITNPNTAKATYTAQVWTDTDLVPTTSSAYTIYSEITISSTSKPRGDVITVTGVGLNANCTTCNIRFKGDTTIHGSGTIDSSGVFTGSFNVDSGTASDTAAAALAVEVTDATGATFTSDNSCTTCDPLRVAQTFQNKAGATPTATSAIPGGTVTVDLFDFSASGTIADNSTLVGTGNTAANKTAGIFTIDSVANTGTTVAATPYKFVVPAGTVLATHKVTITDGSKSATFNLEVTTGQKDLTVTPTAASIGQFVTVSGTGFTKSVDIDAGALTGSGSAVLNTGTAISVDSAGNWSFTTRLDTIESSASRTSNSYTIQAVQGAITGKSTSSGFSRTARTLTISPTTGAPGTNVAVSGTGMTVDTGEVTATAEVTITSNKVALTGTFKFPVNTDGSFSGTITIPNNEVAGTVTLTATDNASVLNVSGVARTNRTATATLTVPTGSVTVDPVSQTTGGTVTVSGENFPPSRTASVLTIGGADAIPTGGVTTGTDGTFSVVIEVPAQVNGGSLLPGVKIIAVTIGQISGSTTTFSIPNPSFTIDPVSAQVEDIITITGTGFNALTSVSVLTIGSADVNPSPAPRASSTGELTAFTIQIPALNPGTYTVVLQTGTAFSATATFTALAAPAATATPTAPEATAVPAEDQAAPRVALADAIEVIPGLQIWSFAGQSWSFFGAALAEGNPVNTVAEVKTHQGVWIFNPEDGNVDVTIFAFTHTLFPGWNQIGL
jgi:hypothetical protein